VAVTETPGRGKGLEHTRVDRLDPVQGSGEVAQQHHRVVVAPVDRDPSRPMPLAPDPLRKGGGLAVAGRGDHAHHQHGLRRKQPIHQGGPRHDTRAGRRGPQLPLQQVPSVEKTPTQFHVLFTQPLQRPGPAVLVTCHRASVQPTAMVLW
jgi:hypothetical protein